MFKIEDGIDMQKVEGRGRPAKYPFDEMEVGQSFAFEPEEGGKYHPSNKVKSAAHQYGRRHGKKFSIRRVDGGYRCWRVE